MGPALGGALGCTALTHALLSPEHRGRHRGSPVSRGLAGRAGKRKTPKEDSGLGRMNEQVRASHRRMGMRGGRRCCVAVT